MMSKFVVYLAIGGVIGTGTWEDSIGAWSNRECDFLNAASVKTNLSECQRQCGMSQGCNAVNYDNNTCVYRQCIAESKNHWAGCSIKARFTEVAAVPPSISLAGSNCICGDIISTSTLSDSLPLIKQCFDMCNGNSSCTAFGVKKDSAISCTLFDSTCGQTCKKCTSLAWSFEDEAERQYEYMYNFHRDSIPVEPSDVNDCDAGSTTAPRAIILPDEGVTTSQVTIVFPDEVVTATPDANVSTDEGVTTSQVTIVFPVDETKSNSTSIEPTEQASSTLVPDGPTDPVSSIANGKKTCKAWKEGGNECKSPKVDNTDGKCQKGGCKHDDCCKKKKSISPALLAVLIILCVLALLILIVVGVYCAKRAKAPEAREAKAPKQGRDTEAIVSAANQDNMQKRKASTEADLSSPTRGRTMAKEPKMESTESGINSPPRGRAVPRKHKAASTNSGISSPPRGRAQTKEPKTVSTRNASSLSRSRAQAKESKMMSTRSTSSLSRSRAQAKESKMMSTRSTSSLSRSRAQAKEPKMVSTVSASSAWGVSIPGSRRPHNDATAANPPRSRAMANKRPKSKPRK